jgi:hypothetical protein
LNEAIDKAKFLSQGGLSSKFFRSIRLRILLFGYLWFTKAVETIDQGEETLLPARVFDNVTPPFRLQVSLASLPKITGVMQKGRAPSAINQLPNLPKIH